VVELLGMAGLDTLFQRYATIADATKDMPN
jgi:hypothetical protein